MLQVRGPQVRPEQGGGEEHLADTSDISVEDIWKRILLRFY